jgi:hypothetical protein
MTFMGRELVKLPATGKRRTVSFSKYTILVVLRRWQKRLATLSGYNKDIASTNKAYLQQAQHASPATEIRVMMKKRA